MWFYLPTELCNLYLEQLLQHPPQLQRPHPDSGVSVCSMERGGMRGSKGFGWWQHMKGAGWQHVCNAVV